jgi:hypothetical protein
MSQVSCRHLLLFHPTGNPLVELVKGATQLRVVLGSLGNDLSQPWTQEPVIANQWRTLSLDVAAVEDRCHCVSFEPTPQEVHLRTAAWFDDQEVFDFIAAHLPLITTHSMRHYIQASQARKAGLDWRKYLRGRWMPDAMRLAAELRDDPGFPTEKDRVRAFIDRSGGSRSTFYNYLKKLPAADKAPQIELANGKTADPAPEKVPA